MRLILDSYQPLDLNHKKELEELDALIKSDNFLSGLSQSSSQNQITYLQDFPLW